MAENGRIKQRRSALNVGWPLVHEKVCQVHNRFDPTQTEIKTLIYPMP